MEKTILVDPGKCLACKSCMMECARVSANADDVYQTVRRIPTPMPRISIQAHDGFSLSILCRHCMVNPCIEACPTDAIRKREDGVVVIDDAKCIGCRSCYYACPLGAIFFDSAQHLAVKCELCVAEFTDVPPCVAACKTGALKYGEYHDIAIERV